LHYLKDSSKPFIYGLYELRLDFMNCRLLQLTEGYRKRFGFSQTKKMQFLIASAQITLKLKGNLFFRNSAKALHYMPLSVS
jgi:hypothetical protein